MFQKFTLIPWGKKKIFSRCRIVACHNDSKLSQAQLCEPEYLLSILKIVHTNISEKSVIYNIWQERWTFLQSRGYVVVIVSYTILNLAKGGVSYFSEDTKSTNFMVTLYRVLRVVVRRWPWRMIKSLFTPLWFPLL